VTINGEAITASPRAEQNIFLPGALTTTSLTVSMQTAAAGCTKNPADVNVIVQHRMQ
jgi:hypothetical protein